MSKEAMKLALESLEHMLEDAKQDCLTVEYWNECVDAITALRKALAEQPAQQEPYTYTSTQSTMCAECGEHKHTPLRIDAMGGYVCLTCIDQKLGSLLGEFGYPKPEQPAQQEPVATVRTWHKNGDQHAELDDWGLALALLPDGKHELYTSPQPPQRTWVGLTDEEIDKTHETKVWDARRSYARAIEAKLKEKNT